MSLGGGNPMMRDHCRKLNEPGLPQIALLVRDRLGSLWTAEC